MLLQLLVALPALIFARWVWKTFIAYHPLDNIQGPASPGFFRGHLGLVFSSWPGRKWQVDIVDTYGRVVLLKGFFGARQLYVADPRALQFMTVKEPEIFEEQAQFISNNKATLGEGILATLGDQHRKQRKILNPVFNVKHLRELVPAFTDIASALSKGIAREVHNGADEVDLVVWLSRTALELIGVGGLGYSFNALDGDTPHEYVVSIKKLGFAAFALQVWRYFLPYVENIGTPALRRALLKVTPSVHIQNIVEAVDVMWKTTLEVYSQYGAPRPESTEKDTSQFKNNIMMVLKQANQAANPAERMTENEMKGQINSLITAANVTTSRSLCRIVNELSLHPEYQARLRAEIMAAREHADGDLDFEKLEALPLMDAIIRETLRRYPPLPLMPRTCQKETVVPLMHPLTGRDGKTITELTVPAGTDIYLGILPTNIDYETWGPDAREWKPERWLNQLPKTVGDAHIPGVYSHQMTFLSGNRACIGFKFALIEIKVVLSMLLAHFRFSPGKDEIEFVHAGIYQPTVNKVLVPTMPVKVEVLRVPGEDAEKVRNTV
ncbi:cytochrome P450 [Exidia glandulosa HHB12029]|uniref:Cytochrome P450 n=1 Tax=Exidia glandulosa HHB12029 TaxID=1314781 RepID=A0A165PXU2_EXIGL|nr:cytochrome P450 [Exidia glandulosa HHB12029]